MKRRNKYDAVIIGCGNIGCELEKYKPGFITSHLSSYKNNKRINLVGVCDIDKKKADKIARENNIRAYTKVKDMLSELNPDLVSICTPDETHYKVLKEVVKCRSVKGIWCEKPIGVSVYEGKEMIKLCKKRNIKLLVNHLRRYDEFYLQIKKNMDQILGKVQTVVCYYSGGIVTVGSHIIDLLNFYFGRCISVRANKSKNKSSYNAELIYLDENGEEIYINLIPCDNKFFSIMEFNFIGSKARLDTMYKPFGDYDYRYYLAEDSKVGIKFIANKKKNILNRNIKRDFFERALKDLIKCIETGKDPISSGETSIRSLEIISALAYSAGNDAKLVRLPFKKSKLRIPKAEGDIKKWKN